MKELLIIRSASFQQLDLNLPEIKKKFPNYKISILTHEHGVKLAEKYEDIKQIYVYPYKDGFSIKRKVKKFNNKIFDALIVPVTNVSGAGFSNVLLFSLSIKAKKKYQCNVISEIKEYTDATIMLGELIRLIYKVIAGFCTIAFSISIFVVLIGKILGKQVGKLFVCK